MRFMNNENRGDMEIEKAVVDESLFYLEEGGEEIRCPLCGVAWFEGEAYSSKFCEHLRFILCTYDQPDFLYTCTDDRVTHFFADTMRWIDTLLTRQIEDDCNIDIDGSLLEHMAKYGDGPASHCLVVEYEPEPPEFHSFITVYGYQRSDQKVRRTR